MLSFGAGGRRTLVIGDRGGESASIAMLSLWLDQNMKVEVEDEIGRGKEICVNHMSPMAGRKCQKSQEDKHAFTERIRQPP